MPTTTATGLASGTRARMPAAEATTAGASSLAAPWRSPNRPAHQRVRVDAAGWTSRATATRVAAVGTHTIPPPTGAPTGPAQLLADFLSGVPDLASFPRGDWLWAQRESCRQAPTAAFDYGDPRGSPVLREVLAGYLRRVRGAAADPERILACTGFAQGLVLTLRVLVRAGVRRVAFEDPGYGDGETMAAAVRAGLEPFPVRVDQGGIDVGAL